MKRDEERSPDQYAPLPLRVQKHFFYFWSVVTLGGLSIALVMFLWYGRNALTWRDGVIAAAILLQAGLYLALVMFNPRWPKPDWVRPAYFIGCLALWTLQMALSPEMFWLGFLYLGQAFGLLPLLPALIAGLYIIAVIYFSGFLKISITGLSGAQLFGLVASAISMVALLIYNNYLGKTSRERAQLIDELTEAHRQLDIAKEKEAELAVLQERERLARDMHDTLGHNLVALSVQLEAVQRLYKVDPQAASAMVDELKTLTRTSMEELRRTLIGLRSSGLNNRSLSQALRELCVDFGQRTGLGVVTNLDQEVDELPAPVTEALWRVSLEALTNIERHAAARQVQLALSARQGEIRLVLEDDGVGFDLQQASAAGHYGMQGMRERVEGLGGTFTVYSSPGQGTRLVVKIPTLEKAHA
jgi:signal transduction histidine kinase